MDIYDRINNAEYISKCNSTEENRYIMALNEIDFWDVYRESKYSDTFLIIDKNGNINFFIKLITPQLIGELLENNKISLQAEWNYYGPEVILSIGKLGNIPGFILEINKNMDNFIIQRFFKSGRVFVQYIIEDEKGIIKLFTEEIQVKREFIERLKYFVELDFYKKYPRIKREETSNEKGYYIKTSADINILEEILDAADGLSHKIRNKQITVYVEANDFYKVIFRGDMQSIGILLDEVCKRIIIFEEGMTEIPGVPFFKYRNGLLYFFEK